MPFYQLFRPKSFTSPLTPHSHTTYFWSINPSVSFSFKTYQDSAPSQHLYDHQPALSHQHILDHCKRLLTDLPVPSAFVLFQSVLNIAARGTLLKCKLNRVTTFFKALRSLPTPYRALGDQAPASAFIPCY